MKRTELEARITDASDGILTPEEIRQLETDLQVFPDLQDDYYTIMKLPEPEAAYPKPGNELFTARINEIRKQIAEEVETPGNNPAFYELSLVWFKRYALAASLLIVTMTSVISWLQPVQEYTDTATIMNDLFYSLDESDADAYVAYLDDFTLD